MLSYLNPYSASKSAPFSDGACNNNKLTGEKATSAGANKNRRSTSGMELYNSSKVDTSSPLAKDTAQTEETVKDDEDDDLTDFVDAEEGNDGDMISSSEMDLTKSPTFAVVATDPSKSTTVPTMPASKKPSPPHEEASANSKSISKSTGKTPTSGGKGRRSTSSIGPFYPDDDEEEYVLPRKTPNNDDEVSAVPINETPNDKSTKVHATATPSRWSFLSWGSSKKGKASSGMPTDDDDDKLSGQTAAGTPDDHDGHKSPGKARTGTPTTVDHHINELVKLRAESQSNVGFNATTNGNGFRRGDDEEDDYDYDYDDESSDGGHEDDGVIDYIMDDGMRVPVYGKMPKKRLPSGAVYILKSIPEGWLVKATFADGDSFYLAVAYASRVRTPSQLHFSDEFEIFYHRSMICGCVEKHENKVGKQELVDANIVEEDFDEDEVEITEQMRDRYFKKMREPGTSASSLLIWAVSQAFSR